MGELRCHTEKVLTEVREVDPLKKQKLQVEKKEWNVPVKKRKSKKKGLYANIHAKRKRIKAGSGERMRKPGSKGAPTAANFKRAAKTAKKRKKKRWEVYDHKLKDTQMVRKKPGKVKAIEQNMGLKVVKNIIKNVIEDKDNG